jgi:hypothetical protein
LPCTIYQWPWLLLLLLLLLPVLLSETHTP